MVRMPAPSRPATVLLLGNYRPTLVLARALSAIGHRVVVDSPGEGTAEFSRFASEVWRHPPIAQQPVAVLDGLRAFLARRPDIGIVFPVTEEFVRLLVSNRDSLPADRRYVLPRADLVATMLDKVAAYRLAEAAGVPVAPWDRVERYDDLATSCDRIGYPVVVRPLGPTRLGGRKALIVATPTDLGQSLPAWPADQPALLVQRKISGPRFNQYFAAQRGRVVRIAQADVGRTDHRDGTGLAVTGRTVPVDERLHGYTAMLAAKLDYHGVGCAQYLVSPEMTTFLELNPRIGGNHAIPEAAGLGLGALAVALAAPDCPDVPVIVGRPGIRYAWTQGDLAGLRTALVRDALPWRDALVWGWQAARTFFSADLHLTWRLDDPLPTIMTYARHLPGMRRVLERWRRPAAVADAGPVRLDEIRS
jgi:biotin carboxylase